MRPPSFNCYLAVAVQLFSIQDQVWSSLEEPLTMRFTYVCLLYSDFGMAAEVFLHHGDHVYGS